MLSGVVAHVKLTMREDVRILEEGSDRDAHFPSGRIWKGSGNPLSERGSGGRMANLDESGHPSTFPNMGVHVSNSPGWNTGEEHGCPRHACAPRNMGVPVHPGSVWSLRRWVSGPGLADSPLDSSGSWAHGGGWKEGIDPILVQHGCPGLPAGSCRRSSSGALNHALSP